MVGDGAFMMLHSELVTSIQEGCKINVVLFDNMTNGCINNLQMEHGMDSYTTEFRFRNPEGGKLDGKLVPVDFAMLAAAYGCKTYRVTTEQQLLDALADARRQTVSTLLDIKVLPKTMVHKYLSWWRVGGAQVADSEKSSKWRASCRKTSIRRAITDSFSYINLEGSENGIEHWGYRHRRHRPRSYPSLQQSVAGCPRGGGKRHQPRQRRQGGERSAAGCAGV